MGCGLSLPQLQMRHPPPNLRRQLVQKHHDEKCDPQQREERNRAQYGVVGESTAGQGPRIRRKKADCSWSREEEKGQEEL